MEFGDKVKFYKIDIDNEAVQQAVIENSGGGSGAAGCCTLSRQLGAGWLQTRSGAVLFVLSTCWLVRLVHQFAFHHPAQPSHTRPPSCCAAAAQWRRCPPSLDTRGPTGSPPSAAPTRWVEKQ